MRIFVSALSDGAFSADRMIACGGTAGCKNQIRNRVEDASSQPFLTLKYRENPVLQDSRLTPPGVKEQMNYPAALASFFARVRAHAH